MRTSERIAERRHAKGLSQAALARLVGVTQPTIGKLEAGISTGSSYLHKIARVLETTPEYLSGEIDDPAEGAPPPRREPTTQVFMMPVVLPAEAALERMFLGLLRSMPGAKEAELAHGLARLLPTGLRTLQGQLRYDLSDVLDDDVGDPPDPAAKKLARQQA